MKLLFLVMTVVLFTSTAQSLTFNSGIKKVQLIELYTSQSCSSCPPAEAWVSGLRKQKGLWKKFIPISFHVDYWDHLSWKDKFSKKEYTRRQVNYDKVIKSGVFTPQIILNGKDFKGWRNSKNKSYINTVIKPGNLRIILDKSKKLAKVTFYSKSLKNELLCYSAYLESGHTTKITSGENEGHNIKQDFIAVNLFNGIMNKNKNNYSCEVRLTFDKKRKAKEKALAFWVIDKKTYEVLQVTGGTIN